MAAVAGGVAYALVHFFKVSTFHFNVKDIWMHFFSLRVTLSRGSMLRRFMSRSWTVFMLP
jgi:hypothetical protein